MLRAVENRSFADVGGSPGGMGSFLLGLVMVCVGGYLLTNQAQIVGSYWTFYGTNTFGITLIPMLFGLAFSFGVAAVSSVGCLPLQERSLSSPASLRIYISISAPPASSIPSSCWSC